jgi:hypothetical protein
MQTITPPPRRRRLGRVLATVAAAATAVVLVPSTAAEAATCRTWAFIGIPGSNQGKAHAGGSLTDTALYGKEIASVKANFVSRKGASNVALYPINYPAKIGWAGTSYNNSVNAGIAETKRIMKNVAASCPSTRFVIAGYSQGAHVGTLVLGDPPIAVTKIHRSAFVGSPLFRDGSVNSVEVASGTVTNSGILNAGRNWQTRWNGKVRDVCINNDLVCEALSTTSTAAHGAYTTTNYPGQTKRITAYLGYNWLAG